MHQRRWGHLLWCMRMGISIDVARCLTESTWNSSSELSTYMGSPSTCSRMLHVIRDGVTIWSDEGYPLSYYGTLPWYMKNLLFWTCQPRCLYSARIELGDDNGNQVLTKRKVLEAPIRHIWCSVHCYRCDNFTTWTSNLRPFSKVGCQVYLQECYLDWTGRSIISTC